MKVGLILFFSIASFSGTIAQTNIVLSLPEQADGVISFDISANIDNAQPQLIYNLLSVFVASETNEYAESLAMQGNFSILENKLIFKPYFSFEIGLAYVLRLKNIDSEEFYYVPFQIGEKEKVDEAKLLTIFPTANLLPENLLRFYFYFQTPMKQEEALKHIKLIDENGNADDHAFMKFKEELWSSDGKRLTILFDPGRIKRGVFTNEIQGPALENTKHYHLNVSAEWQDVHGQKLFKNTKKEIIVIEAIREKIKIEKWALEKPSLDSHGKLFIHFDRIMDHALIESMIQIRGDEENLIEGQWELLDNEKRVQFIPQNKWEKGDYKIEFDTRLEDVSGNNLQNLLDHAIADEDRREKFQFIELVIE